MKFLKPIFATCTIIYILFSCEKTELANNMNYQALNPLNADTAAGNWKLILLSKANEIALTAPIAVTSPDYKLELLEIKSWQNNITSSEEES